LRHDQKHKAQNKSSEPTSLSESFDKVSKINSDFLTILRNDPAFAKLSSESKNGLYRSHGAVIGQGVVWGENSCIIAEKLIIGDDVHIGTGTLIEGKQVYLGHAVRIGKDSNLLSFEIHIGDATVIGDRVGVDVAGEGVTPRSCFRVGQCCAIRNEVLINVASARMEEIWIGEDSWIGPGVMVMPGIKVGEGSIILANSVVTNSIDSFSFVGGVPARPILKDISRPLSREEKDQKIQKILTEIIPFLEQQNCQVIPLEESATLSWKIILPNQYEDILVYTNNPLSIKIQHEIPQDENSIFDLEYMEFRGTSTILSNELRNFFRRYGIRFTPIHWHYNWKNGLKNLNSNHQND